ncbi:MAG: LamG domain-containing protein [Epsilonproteobacteria bacterium]|nr:LamG domain-containing protein [Campylobacterota bacterium]
MPAMSGYFDEFYMFKGQMDDTQVQELYDNVMANNNIDGTARSCGCNEDPDAFSCPTEAFIFTSASNTDPTDFYELDLTTGSSALRANDFHPDSINAAGYNTVDNYIWGYDNGTNKVVKIDKNNKVISYDVTGLPKIPYYSGDVDKNGILYLFGNNMSSEETKDGRAFKVDTQQTPPKLIGEMLLPSYNAGDNSANFGDWAFHPINGKLYTISETAYALMEVDPSTGVTKTVLGIDRLWPKVDGVRQIDGVTVKELDFHSNVFDKEGNFYFYGDDGHVFRINLANPSSPQDPEFFSDISSLTDKGDGARCPNATLTSKKLYAEYRFDECKWDGTPGEIKDSSGNGYHATGKGYSATEDIGLQNIQNGKIERAGEFPNETAPSSHSVVWTDIDMDSDIGGKGAISFWFKSEDNWIGGVGRTLIDATTSNDKFFYLALKSDGKLYYAFEDSNDNDFKANTKPLSFVQNEWVHIAITWDLTNSNRLYINGSEQNLTITANNITQTNFGQLSDIHIGDYINSGESKGRENSAYGFIDEVKIFTGVISSTDISSLYNNEFAGLNWDGSSRTPVSCEEDQDPFTCDETLYLSNQSKQGTGSSDGKTWLHSISRDNTPYDFQAIGEGYDNGDKNTGYNALGYNIKDNFMYALDGNNLLRIDKNSVVKNLGIVAGLDPAQLYAGEFDRDGYYYVHGNGGASNSMYKINIDLMQVVSTINLSESVRFWDMAIDNTGSYFYTMLVGDGDGDSDYNNDKVAKINISTGEIETIGESHSDMTSYISLVFADRDGDIFMMANEGGFYKADPITGAVYALSSTENLTFFNDGTSCPDANVSEPVSVTINDVTDTEGDSGRKEFTFTLTFSQATTVASGLWVTFTDGVDAIAPIDTAGHIDTHPTEGDFDGQARYIDIPIGTTTFDIVAEVIGDTRMENHEEFYVDLYAPDNILILDNRGVGTIINDDVVKFRVERKDSDTIAAPTTDYQQQQKSQFYTQLVNRDFDYSLVSYAPDYSEESSEHQEYDIEDVTLKVVLYDHNSTKSNDILYEDYIYFEKGNLKSRTKVLKNDDLIIPQATRYAQFHVSCLLDGNGSIVYGKFDTKADFNNSKTVNNAHEGSGYSDMFAIRPLAYRVKIEDTSEYKNRVYKTNNSTDTQPVALVAEYPYNLNVIATVDDNDSVATTYRTFSPQELNITLEFDKTGTSSCHDSNDSNLIENPKSAYLFNNGKLQNATLSHDNVGNYDFKIEDINWTYYDKNVDPNLAGCILDSTTNTANGSGRYGCNIGSDVDKNYKNIKTEFYAYEFDLNNTLISNVENNDKNHTYMSDLALRQDMGVSIGTDVIAKGFAGTTLTNYTAGCFAKDVEVTLDYNITTDQVYNAPTFVDVNTTDGTPVNLQRIVRYNDASVDVNNLEDDTHFDNNVTIPASLFLDPDKGESHVDILYNFAKNLSSTTNPIKMVFNEFNATSVPSTANANGELRVPFKDEETGIFNSDRKVKTFYFAKVSSDSENYPATLESSYQTPLTVSIFCDANRTWCSEILTADVGLNSAITQLGWYTAIKHDSDTDGKVRGFILKDATVTPNIASLPNFNDDGRGGRIESIETHYSGTATQITTRVDVIVDEWLRYHENPKLNGTPFWRNTFKGQRGTMTGIGQTGGITEIESNVKSSNKMDW